MLEEWIEVQRELRSVGPFGETTWRLHRETLRSIGTTPHRVPMGTPRPGLDPCEAPPMGRRIPASPVAALLPRVRAEADESAGAVEEVDVPVAATRHTGGEVDVPARPSGPAVGARRSAPPEPSRPRTDDRPPGLSRLLVYERLLPHPGWCVRLPAPGSGAATAPPEPGKLQEAGAVTDAGRREGPDPLTESNPDGDPPLDVLVQVYRIHRPIPVARLARLEGLVGPGGPNLPEGEGDRGTGSPPVRFRLLDRRDVHHLGLPVPTRALPARAPSASPLVASPGEHWLGIRFPFAAEEAV